MGQPRAHREAPPAYTRLLAKSAHDPLHPQPAETLPGHLLAVGRVAQILAEDRGRWVLDALGLRFETWEDRLAAAAVRGALLHDIGKANDHFQRMIRGQSRLPQALRHEVVSLWIAITYSEFDHWFFADLDAHLRYAAIRAALGHHLQFSPESALTPRAAGTVEMQVLAGHPDFAQTLSIIRDLLHLPAAPILDNHIILLDGDDLDPLRDFLWKADAWWHTADEEVRRFAAAITALVIAADVCGSARIHQGEDPAQWAKQVLDLACQEDDLRAAVTRRIGNDPIRPFQQEVAESPARLTLVTAGTGTGKTVTAYLWGKRLVGRKLFYCYPTTGTATEGFQDYALPAFERDAALVHSRAAVDIERILENGEEHAVQNALRQQGLQPWGAKVIVCTADAVLGLVQNNRVGLFSFPALAGAGFVFDEVHLYDNRLFGSLLTFLETMRGAPVLLLTATLPPGRLTALRDLAARLDEPLAEIAGPREFEELPRYVIAQADYTQALAHATDAISVGKRVLWVVNTVERAVAIAQDAEGRGIPTEPYHSRYRYLDRLQRHRAVVDCFKAGGSPRGILAVTTQVCEVSLDISADLLISELAPPAALIQRLGRLNRWATPESHSGPLTALIIEPEGYRPYEKEDLDTGRDWLRQVIGGPRSQRDLHDAFATVLAGEHPSRKTHSAWLDEAWTIEPAPLRDAGATVTVLREEDLAQCLDRRGQPVPREVMRYSIPMLWHPVAGEAYRWRQVGGALVSPSGRIEYSERWGARWRS